MLGMHSMERALHGSWPIPPVIAAPVPTSVSRNSNRTAMAQSGTAKDDIVLGQDSELENQEVLHEATQGEGERCSKPAGPRL